MSRYKQIWILPETKNRFQEHVTCGQSADHALNEMIDIIEQMDHDMFQIECSPLSRKEIIELELRERDRMTSLSKCI